LVRVRRIKLRYPPDGKFTSVDAVAALYAEGLPVSRDRLYKMADVLFDSADVQARRGLQRRYDLRQVELLAAAFRLYTDLGVEPARLAALLRNPDDAEDLYGRLKLCRAALDSFRRDAAQAAQAPQEVSA
jgi:hypothetical protein